MKALFLRLYRLGLLLILGWLLYHQQSRLSQTPPTSLELNQVLTALPRAASLGQPDKSGWTPIYSNRRILLGFAKSTRPESDRFIGYSGPTECLIILNPKREILSVQLIQSQDTPEYVEKVQQNQTFWDNLKSDSQTFVSGATLTSASIRQGVASAMGAEAASLKFPEELTLEEIQSLLPAARSIKNSPRQPRWKEIYDQESRLIAYGTTTAPDSESIIGYQGPSDSLLLLDPTSLKVIAVKLRRSYDTEDYVGYITDDSFYLKSFSKYNIEQLQNLDFKKEKIEGVSGATQTSWAIAEALKKTSQAWHHHTLFESWLKAWDLKQILLLAIALSSTLMMMTSLRGNKYFRRFHQVALVGFVGLYSGALLSEALLIGWARHGIPWEKAPGLVAVLGFALLSPVFTRRHFYCHHYCPHGTVQQWLQKISPFQIKLSTRSIKVLSTLPAALLVGIIILSFLKPNLPLNYIEPFDAWSLSVVNIGILTFAIASLLISLFIPMAYCRFGCPTGTLFKFLRYAGHADHWSLKDTLALILVVSLILIEFV